MPVVGLRAGFFDAVEDALNVPDLNLDYQDDLDVLTEGESAADPTVLQLSSSLIRVVMPTMSETGEVIDFELRISGSGIGPVSSLKALIKAIDQGFATGTISKFQVLNGADTVFQIALASTGYTFSSGDQWLKIDGRLPLTFTQMADFADLFNRVSDIDTLTNTQRAALFDDLSAYGVSGLSFGDGATEYFGFDVSATQASLSINGMTFTARGTFPDNLGEDLELLWQLSTQMDGSGTIDLSTLDNLSVSSVRITDPAGRLMGTITNPMDGGDMVIRVDSRVYDEVKMDMEDQGDLRGGLGAVRSVLAGLSGNDLMFAGGANDLLLGGTGNDTLNGEAGLDRLNGGAGRDILTGGGQADAFVFLPGAGLDTITDFAEGVDKIEMTSANSLTDLTFTDTGRNVRIDYNSIHVIVANIEISDLAVAANFVF